MKLIGIVGKKQSGKDTIADYLVGKYGYQKYALADPIKDILRTMFMWSDSSFQNGNKEVIDPMWGLSPRQAMQWFGTEFAQFMLCKKSPLFESTIGRRIWVERAFFTMLSDPVHTHWVISDVRFHHEANALKSYGATLIKVERPLYQSDAHISETECDEIQCDFNIQNQFSLDELQEAVSLIMDEIQ